MISRATKYWSRHGDPTKRPIDPPLPIPSLTSCEDDNGSQHRASVLDAEAVPSVQIALPHHRLMARLLHVSPRQVSITDPTAAPPTVRTVAKGVRHRLSRLPWQASVSQVGGSASSLTHDSGDIALCSISSASHTPSALGEAHDGISAPVPQLVLNTVGLWAADASPFTSPTSTKRWAGEDSDVESDGYDTPLTSPESSPLKRYGMFWQMDGAGSSREDVTSPTALDEAVAGSTDPKSGEVNQDGHLADGSPAIEAESQMPMSDPETDLDTDDEASTEIANLFSQLSADDRQVSAASLAQEPPRTPTRHPSVLFSHRSRNFSPRQRSLRRKGISYPDRLLPSRELTPTKEGLVTSGHAESLRSGHDTSDPFAPTTGRSIRMAEQYATLRGPAIPLRPAGVASTRVPYVHDTRSASIGNVWSVGGVSVTEGVLSTTDGRGGRVTSGTSAPHYSADFLRKRLPTDDEATHARRLARAMNLQSENTMIQSRADGLSPSRPLVDAQNDVVERVTWKDGK